MAHQMPYVGAASVVPGCMSDDLSAVLVPMVGPIVAGNSAKRRPLTCPYIVYARRKRITTATRRTDTIQAAFVARGLIPNVTMGWKRVYAFQLEAFGATAGDISDGY